MTYSFDDANFGTTDDRRNKIDIPIVARPPKLTNSEWYTFAGKLSDYFNAREVQGD